MRWASIICVILAGCSSATTFRMVRADGTTIEAQSAKQQSEERADWKVTVGADGSVSLNLGTKGTVPVNMTSETLQSILGMIPAGDK